MPLIKVADRGINGAGGKRPAGIDDGRFLIFAILRVSPVAGGLIVAFEVCKVEPAVCHIQGPENILPHSLEIAHPGYFGDNFAEQLVALVTVMPRSAGRK